MFYLPAKRHWEIKPVLVKSNVKSMHSRVNTQNHGVLPQVSGAGELRHAERLRLLLQFSLQLCKTIIIIIIILLLLLGLQVNHTHSDAHLTGCCWRRLPCRRCCYGRCGTSVAWLFDNAEWPTASAETPETSWAEKHRRKLLILTTNWALKVIAHWVTNFHTLKNKYDLMLCQSRLHNCLRNFHPS